MKNPLLIVYVVAALCGAGIYSASPAAAVGTVNLGNESITELLGIQAPAGAGTALSPAGDVNGDGYDDVLIGAPGDGMTDTGIVYLVYGDPDIQLIDTDVTGDSVSTFNLSVNADAVFTGEVAGDQAGFSVSSAGDINADGCDEILVGAPKQDAGDDEAGAAYLVYGGDDDGNEETGCIFDAPESVTLSTGTSSKLTNSGEDDMAGYAVAAGGDINNDGFDDFLVGAPEGGHQLEIYKERRSKGL